MSVFIVFFFFDFMIKSYYITLKSVYFVMIEHLVISINYIYFLNKINSWTNMRLHAGKLSKWFSTNITFIFLKAFMNARYVFLKVSQLTKSFFALVAFIFADSIVYDSNMFFQIWQKSASIVTFITFEMFDSFMNNGDMTI